MFNAQRLKPVEIKRLGTTGIGVTWSDGSSVEYSSKVLREQCPCASCRELRGDSTHAKPLTGTKPSGKKSLKIVQASANQELSLQNIWGVGQYAIGMSWGDGHSTGIYTYEYLWELAEGGI